MAAATYDSDEGTYIGTCKSCGNDDVELDALDECDDCALCPGCENGCTDCAEASA